MPNGDSQNAVMAVEQKKWFLKEWRVRRGLTQEQLADMVGTSKGYISDLENAKRRYNQELLEGLAAALQLAPRDLLSTPDLPEVESELATLQREWREATAARRTQIMAVVRALKDTGTDG